MSSTPRAMGPSLSRDQQSVMAPVRGTRPKVGRSPATPQRIAGAMMLPPVSLAIAKATQPGRRGGARARAAPRCAFLEEPRVVGLAAEPDVVEGKGAQAQLRDEHGPGLVEPLDHGGVLGGTRSRNGSAPQVVADAGGVEEVLGAPRDAMERTAVAAGRDLGVGLLRLGEGQLTREGDGAVDLRLEALETLEVDPGQALRGEDAGLDPAGEGRESGEGDVLVAARQRRRRTGAAHEPASRRSRQSDPGGRDPSGWPAPARDRGPPCAAPSAARRAAPCETCQFPAACARSAAVYWICISFSASAIVAG